MCYIFCKAKRIITSSKRPGPPLGPTKNAISLVQETVSNWVKFRVLRLTTHRSLQPTSKLVGLYLHYHIRLYGVHTGQRNRVVQFPFKVGTICFIVHRTWRLWDTQEHILCPRCNSPPVVKNLSIEHSYSRTFSAEIKNVWSYTYISSYVFLMRSLGADVRIRT